jgi:hypothetical protein
MIAHKLHLADITPTELFGANCDVEACWRLLGSGMTRITSCRHFLCARADPGGREAKVTRIAACTDEAYAIDVELAHRHIVEAVWQPGRPNFDPIIQLLIDNPWPFNRGTTIALRCACNGC